MAAVFVVIVVVGFFWILVVGSEGAAVGIGIAAAAAAAKSVVPVTKVSSPFWLPFVVVRAVAYLACFYYASPTLQVLLLLAAAIDFASDFGPLSATTGLLLAVALLVADKTEAIWIYSRDSDSVSLSVLLLRTAAVLLVGWGTVAAQALRQGRTRALGPSEKKVVQESSEAFFISMLGLGLFFLLPFYGAAAVVLFAGGVWSLNLLRPVLSVDWDRSDREAGESFYVAAGTGAIMIISSFSYLLYLQSIS